MDKIRETVGNVIETAEDTVQGIGEGITHAPKVMLGQSSDPRQQIYTTHNPMSETAKGMSGAIDRTKGELQRSAEQVSERRKDVQNSLGNKTENLGNKVADKGREMQS